MNILIISTGGTIESRINPISISPSVDAKFQLIEEYRKYEPSVEFSVITPYTVLSENLSAQNLNLLIKTVKENLEGGFDGIIITHGTDTLQFSAAAVGFAAADTKIPIIFVSSNYVLTDSRANGHANFKAAAEYIRTGGKAGVFAAYKNEGGRAQIMPATGLYTFLEDTDFVLQAKTVSCGERDFVLTDDCGILTVDPHPADRYGYNLDGVKAVLFRPYHSGTLPTSSTELNEFTKRAKARNIPMFVCCARDCVTYESAAEFERLGIIRLAHSPFAATFVKLWIGISENKNLVEFMTKK